MAHDSRIPARRVSATFAALRRELDRMNTAIDRAERLSGEDFLLPEDEDYRALAAGVAELLDRYWHLHRGGG